MSLTFQIHLPEKTPEEFDVIARYLEIEIQGDEDIQPVEVPPDQLIVGPFFGDHNSLVKVQCWNINDAHNTSKEPSVLEVILKDPFHPPTPGLMTLEITGKTHAQNLSYRVPTNGEKRVLSAEDLARTVTTLDVTKGQTEPVHIDEGEQVEVHSDKTPLHATIQVTSNNR